jgi:hypothetical protein
MLKFQQLQLDKFSFINTFFYRTQYHIIPGFADTVVPPPAGDIQGAGE